MSLLGLEKEEEEKVKKWCDKHGVEALKLNLQGNAGWPDRLFIFPKGRVIWIEMKRSGQWPEPLQWVRIRYLRFRGHYVYVCDSARKAIAILEAARLSESWD